ncbi:hypothetical protein T440DRAFT_39787 [Plenodomus tracheiphilus IPT5]|uniref:Uncharacterized protein n=1 Tax=Plenodomus tracheiphilus IPT5 TaxID=1408161 RepID=A0A6A7BCX7_9PLEO|nr:hypothetical protein T440DRAFT_39787 [Plenodomus tracheiphilus IPT5]
MQTRSHKVSPASSMSLPSPQPCPPQPIQTDRSRPSRPSLVRIRPSLVVVLPLPQYLGRPKRIASLALIAPAPIAPTHDRTFWGRNLGIVGTSLVTCRSLLQSLGLKRTDVNSRYPRFVIPAVTALASEATRLAITLPRNTN